MNIRKTLLVMLSSLLAGCNFDFSVGGPIIDQIFGHVDSPLVYCESAPTETPIVTSGFGFNLENTRNNASSITAANVAGLMVDYTLVDEKEDIRRGAPAATENVLYYTGVDKVYAIDRATGCAYWDYEPPATWGKIRSASVLLVDNAPLSKRTVIIGTAHAQVVAIDATTGNPIWDAFVANPGWLTVNGVNKTTSQITGGMQYHDGRIYVPIATHEVANAAVQPYCCKRHGALKVIDSGTGAAVWEYQTTVKASMQNGNPTRYGPNGVSIWSTPMIDHARNQVILGTSQNFSPPVTENSDAVVALDMMTGAEKWIFKATPVDYYNGSCGVDNAPFDNCDAPNYDYDVITPVLADNAGTPVIIAADKAGMIYSLDPMTGAKNWERKVGAGGILGGIHWAVAVDATKVYAGVADFQVPKSSLLGSTLADLLEISPSQVPGATPGLYAVNLNDGSVAWEVHPTHTFNGATYDSIFSAAVTVTNDVLFAASLDGEVAAYDTADGTRLWSHYTAVPVIDVMGRHGEGGSIDSVGAVVAGNQMFLNSGYSIFNIGGKNEWQAGPGNAIFVYKLP